MPARYVTVDRETPMLLPPDLRDWVPADHLVHFMIDGQSNRMLTFLAAQGPFCPNQFTLDGRPLSNEHSSGLDAMAAVAGLAADRALARSFVKRLWDAPVPERRWRYYDGILDLLALLEVSGRFQIHSPAAS